MGLINDLYICGVHYHGFISRYHKWLLCILIPLMKNHVLFWWNHVAIAYLLMQYKVMMKLYIYTHTHTRVRAYVCTLLLFAASGHIWLWQRAFVHKGGWTQLLVSLAAWTLAEGRPPLVPTSIGNHHKLAPLWPALWPFPVPKHNPSPASSPPQTLWKCVEAVRPSGLALASFHRMLLQRSSQGTVLGTSRQLLCLTN